MNNFITNSTEKTLKSRISDLIKESSELKFLVGFFYFSGLQELIDSLQQNDEFSLKILVGLNVDYQSYGLVEYCDATEKTRVERIEAYHNSVLTALNNDDFDNETFYSQAQYVIDMIEQKRIIIRKTSRPNHAKLYLFKFKPTQFIKTDLLITGSSNLTKAGLVDRQEFNVEISDYGFSEAEQYFDELWNSAIPITDDKDGKERKRLLDNLTQKTLLAQIHPFDAYMFVVKTWLDAFYKQESSNYIRFLLEKKHYKPYKYQIDAVTQALSIIEENNGVILADVVGLGKSVIASLIARKLDKRGIIICPPGLIGDNTASSGWKKYKEDFELYNWEVRSAGNLDDIIQFINNTDNIEVVIIDEAHRYRNSSTETYEKIKTICRGRTVILLTATPFNNTPADMLALLSLFIVPKQSNITLNSNLVDLFRFYNNLFKDLAFIRKNWKTGDTANKSDARKKYKALFGDDNIDPNKIDQRAKFLSKQIRDVIEPVTIRRNRLDLINDPDYKEEVKNLSQVADPQDWYYELSDKQSKFYDNVIEKYFTNDPNIKDRFKGPVYKPYKYESELADETKLTKQEQIDRLSQDNLYDILRRQMVKRFESSFGAFKQSVNNILNNYENIKQFIINSNGKYILNRPLIKSADADDPNSINDILAKFTEKNADQTGNKNKIYDVNKFVFKDEFFADIDSDIKLFNRMLKEIDELKLTEHDPKKQALLKKLDEVLKTPPLKDEPSPKAVIFSEYADTVRYLEPDITSYFHNRVLVITGNISPQNLKNINTNFDASFPNNKQKNDYDILLSTDKLSEGFNLNRASLVVNYDIPWNPVRVIQRVGRINRISKKVFKTLYIANFFPTERGADIIKSKEIASNKMFMIHQTLGEDARIFEVDEEPSPAKLFTKIQTNPYELEQESLYTKMKKQMRQWEELYPDRVKALAELPIRIKTAKPYFQDSLVMFIRKGKLFAVSPDLKDENNQLLPLPMEDAFARIECTPETEKLALSNTFWQTYQMLKEEAEKFSYKQSQQSNSTKAYNFISYLLENDIPELLNWRSFLIMLREDIDKYGTLPENTLRTIADWDNNGKPNYAEIAKNLESLSKTLGKHYLDKVKQELKAYQQQVIVAIENRIYGN
ncbi:MAG TPA: helicase-related protein [Candidatus Cloacimonadota bacterium]|nr:helicase-related protein [Candidatus Cloacimonadota bacterium]HQL15546.1 helicase-related protein [Candidatus Cloacimonadota bacterium]